MQKKDWRFIFQMMEKGCIWSFRPTTLVNTFELTGPLLAKASIVLLLWHWYCFFFSFQLKRRIYQGVLTNFIMTYKTIMPSIYVVLWGSEDVYKGIPSTKVTDRFCKWCHIFVNTLFFNKAINYESERLLPNHTVQMGSSI